MKVCVISSSVFAVPLPNYGGLEAIAYHCAKGLAELGHEVALVAPDGSTCPNVTVIPTGPERIPEKLAYKRYWQELLKYDCIIDHSWDKWSYILKAEGRLKSPVLGVLHAPVNTMLQSLPPVEKPCFVCISDNQRQHFEALFSPAKARTCHNGIDLDFYKPIEGIKRSNRFLFLARFSTIKGPDLAIEACRKAGVGLDLVGDTSITNEPEFLDKCKSLCDWGAEPNSSPSYTNTSNRVRMCGPCTRAETVWWYSQAHCLLHPNQRFREPFGLAPVEAMACGCPVIAWDYGAMRETVRHGEDAFMNDTPGWLVKSTDELVTAIMMWKDMGSWRTEQIEHLREWASQFSVQNMCKRYAELCEEALSGGW